MKIAILGWGSQGQSAYEYFVRLDHDLTVHDADNSIETPKNSKTRLGNDYLKDLANYDMLVRTPALHPRDIQQANPDSPDILDKVWSNTNEFFKVCPTKNIIGVTGTKGKGTTSALIAKMLEACGKTVHLGGNIGTPPLELLKKDIQPDDYVVLELANFQLIDLKASPHTAVCLMVEPEHMDWHEDLEEYIAAKQQLFIHQTPDDIAVYYAKSENSESVAGASQGKLIPYYEPPGAIIENDDVVIDGNSICATDEIKLIGKHNWQNVCAAVTTVWQIDQNIEALRSVLTSFAGLPFRLELIKEIRGVKYYNDSFASQPEATIAALDSIPGSKIMIVGGLDRGLSLASLAKQIGHKDSSVKQALLIGESSKKLAKELDNVGFTDYKLLAEKDMRDIVKSASSVAQSGDSVILSPGFASFDMFKNFEDRGLQYNQAVTSL